MGVADIAVLTPLFTARLTLKRMTNHGILGFSLNFQTSPHDPRTCQFSGGSDQYLVSLGPSVSTSVSTVSGFMFNVNRRSETIESYEAADSRGEDISSAAEMS